MPLTAVGRETARRLRLNREQLTEYRVEVQRARKQSALIAHLADVTARAAEAEGERATLLQERSELLKEQHQLLEALLKLTF